MPLKKTTRVEKSVPAKKRLRLTGAIGPKGTLIVAGCVMAGGILAAARQPAQPVMTTRMEPVAAVAASAKGVPASNPRGTAAEPASSPAAKAAAVTVTGCLDRDGDGFRLKDTSGVEAPRARSWKSGFLKKGSATLDVVDAAHTLKLADQVGRRVSVTGALVDREMRARSVRRVAASCSAK
jgi:hypothetical protein